MTYSELQVTTNYSFLRGASHPEELFAEAAILGLPALGITDRNTLCGIVRAWEASKTTGVRLIVGCRLDLQEGMSLLAYPMTRVGYANLCRLLTLGKSRAGKAKCSLSRTDITEHGTDILYAVLPDTEERYRLHAKAIVTSFPRQTYLALVHRPTANGRIKLHQQAAFATCLGIPTVATGDVLYHSPERRHLLDVVTCIREGCTIDELGYRREATTDRSLREPQYMKALFADFPDAVARTGEIVERCTFDLSELRYQYPDEIEDPSLTPQQTLESLAWAAAAQRYSGGIPAKTKDLLIHELALIERLAYAPYFLTVNNIVRYARSQNILCQGRGSAANSVVCYVLGITAIDPVQADLLFERFVSSDRQEPPDIDVDFDHSQRERVIQWVYETYGRQRAALCATVMRFRPRGAIREVGKVFGLTEDVTGSLASQVWGWSEEGIQEKHAADINLNPDDHCLRMAIDFAQQLIGFPRHLGQHPGGFVLTRDRLDDLVPIEPASMQDRQVIEWDKDDVDALRFMKVDVLGLGMLGCMSRAFDLLRNSRGIDLDMAAVPQDDPETYAMIQQADTLGVFQIESRAQMSMLPRMKPKTLYDLVIEVAIVRPGPIQGDMVHPYLRRREGIERPSYPHPELERVLGKTLGVPLFQEQAMNVAIHCAGFAPSEADALRRSMATFKVTGGVAHFKKKLITGMVERGYSAEFAERTFSQIEGFGSYGFPESHAASFALIAYVSSWMKCHHPDVFCCALLNAQPMGFYAPAQIVRDAREHDVEVRPICINASDWDCTLEATAGRLLAVRLGLRMAKGLKQNDAQALVKARADGRYVSLDDVHARSGLTPSTLATLAQADAFCAFGLSRREAVWTIRSLRPVGLPLFDGAHEIFQEPSVSIPSIPAGRTVVDDYASVGLTLRSHPLSFLRPTLNRRGMKPCRSLADVRPGRTVTVAGLVLVRQRPGSAKGVLFVTIEDESGIANLIIWPSVFEAHRRIVLSGGMISCRGKVQREGIVTHLVAERLEDFSALLQSVGSRDAGESPDRQATYSPGGSIKVPTRDFR